MSSYINRLLAAKRNVKLLQKLSTENAEPFAFDALLNETLSFVPLRAINPIGEELHRSRWCERDRLFSHLDELKYPRADKVIEKNRLNDVGESVLYAAAGELGSIIESRPELGRLFTISQIERNSTEPLHFISLGVSGKPYSQAPSNGLERLVLGYLHNEISKSVKRKEEYNSTIALAHFFLRKEIKGLEPAHRLVLIYPSAHGKTVCSHETINIAMTPETFDQNYKIRKTSVCCLTNEETHYQMNGLNEGSVHEDGTIEWKLDFHAMRESINHGLDVDGKLLENIKASAIHLDQE